MTVVAAKAPVQRARSPEAGQLKGARLMSVVAARAPAQQARSPEAGPQEEGGTSANRLACRTGKSQLFVV